MSGKVGNLPKDLMMARLGLVRLGMVGSGWVGNLPKVIKGSGKVR